VTFRLGTGKSLPFFYSATLLSQLSLKKTQEVVWSGGGVGGGGWELGGVGWGGGGVNTMHLGLQSGLTKEAISFHQWRHYKLQSPPSRTGPC
jgi:hypothetical protein